MEVWSFYELASGLLSGHRFGGDQRDLAANTPDGCGARLGAHDHLSQRVDLSTGQVVDWQPPAPPDDDFTTHRWHADTKRWVGHPTPAAIERDRRAALVTRMVAVEARQNRAMRELALDPSSLPAKQQLELIDCQLDDLRNEYNNPPPAARSG